MVSFFLGTEQKLAVQTLMCTRMTKARVQLCSRALPQRMRIVSPSHNDPWRFLEFDGLLTLLLDQSQIMSPSVLHLKLIVLPLVDGLWAANTWTFFVSSDTAQLGTLSIMLGAFGCSCLPFSHGVPYILSVTYLDL